MAGGQRREAKAIVPNLALGTPLVSPRLTREEALAAAKQAGWVESLFSHAYSMEYGSYTSRSVIAGKPVGTRDVWKITITGLHLARPGGRSGGEKRRPPAVTTLVIYVDNKAGKYLEALGY